MNCKRCFKEITIRNRTGPKGNMYCSKECSWKNRNEKRSPGRNKKCQGCQELFLDKSRVNNCKLCPDCFEYRGDVYKYNIPGKLAKYLRLIKNCQSCGSTKRLCIDHDHKSGKVRGVICHKCNSAIGLFDDDIRLLQNAISYLKGELK